MANVTTERCSIHREMTVATKEDLGPSKQHAVQTNTALHIVKRFVQFPYVPLKSLGKELSIKIMENQK